MDIFDSIMQGISLHVLITPRYISLVAASCMVLYGYDASVYNSVQGSKHWVAFFNSPDTELIGAVNTAYTVGAIIAGWFLGGPLADYLGRRKGMAIVSSSNQSSKR